MNNSFKNDTCGMCGMQLLYSDPNGLCPSCNEKYYVDYSGVSRRQLYLLFDSERIARRRVEAKLKKADHDRQRYAHRIRLLQAQQQMLSREYNALRIENDILKKALEACERRVLYVEGVTPERSTGEAECGHACAGRSGPEVAARHQENGII